MSAVDKRESRKSDVRINLTYFAASFLFGIGLLLIGWFMYKNDNTNALAVFSTILPTTTFIIGYWFAKRSGERRDPEMPEGMRELQPTPPAVPDPLPGDGGQRGEPGAQNDEPARYQGN